ncbi:MAG: cell envelope integrity protein CreD, partial [Pseudomonadota bacterium]|nr:cell envelope integrity protein CreD [Pseudomonadota bacterium]
GKLVALGAVLVALMLALGAVSGVVDERAGRLREAEASVAASLASSQTVLGPILQRDCVESWEETQGEGKDRKTVTLHSDNKLAEAPASLDIGAKVAIEPRYRGIFKVNGYVLKATLAAQWKNGAALVPRAEHLGSRMQCDAPTIFVALGDSRGVRSATVKIDGTPTPVLPGTEHAAHPRGFHVDVADAYAGSTKPLAVQMAIEVVGTGDLAFAAVGDATHVALASDWPHPSFVGRFLPAPRSVSDSGFTAEWSLTSLATTAPQEAATGAPACVFGDTPPESPAGRVHTRCVETFGVAFIDPVSPYTLSDRATKYGLLFIALTFVGVAAVEVMKRVRVHPIQYLLVGCAIAVFFLLLASLSEHVAFAIAYLAASTACTVLLAFYGRFVLGGARAGLAFGAAVAVLYGVLYALLQLEQNALVLGSMLLFAVIAAMMVATRHIDWYALFARMRSDAAPAAPTI